LKRINATRFRASLCVLSVSCHWFAAFRAVVTRLLGKLSQSVDSTSVRANRWNHWNQTQHDTNARCMLMTWHRYTTVANDPHTAGRPYSTISRAQLMIQEVDKRISREAGMPGMHAASIPRHGPRPTRYLGGLGRGGPPHLLRVPGSSYPYIWRI